ncbi:MAG: hypothetical protein JWN34_4992, partial [Bryobacterales bacterium]|nr:hypothetical protein [Bryobacterales bacterium]
AAVVLSIYPKTFANQELAQHTGELVVVVND